MVDVPNVSGLIYDLKAAYGLPLVVFIMFAVNRVFSPNSKFNSRLSRLSVAFCLLAFAVLLPTLLYQDREAAHYLWTTASVAKLLLYIAVGLATVLLFIGIAYWKLRPALWKSDWS